MHTLSRIVDKVMGDRDIQVPCKPNLDPNKNMNALVWNGVKDVQYTTTPAPMLTDPKDVIIRVKATTICGSDIHLVDGSIPTMRSGDILGHEFLGIIEEVGSEVLKLQKGQRVIVAFDIACGNCEFCDRQEFSGCKMTNPSNLQSSLYGHNMSAMYGYSHLTGGVPGGQAELVRVPYADVNCLVVPDDLEDEKALLLTDVVPTSYHGCKLGKVKQDDVVGIWGLGPIGLLTGVFCKNMGARRVVGIDNVPERLQKAESLGLEVIDFNKKDVVETLKEMFPTGIDVAIECAGGEYSKSWTDRAERALNLETDTADIFKEMFQSVRPFGRVSVIGVYIGFANHFPVGMMMEKGLTIRGGQCPVQKYWKALLQDVVDGKIDPSVVVTHRGTLKEGPEFYQKFLGHEEGILKVILRPEGTTPE
jgi:threonine dehydrogenase-like Zn-dependent dehydrogenase